jgi:hypothetical protein
VLKKNKKGYPKEKIHQGKSCREAHTDHQISDYNLISTSIYDGHIAEKLKETTKFQTIISSQHQFMMHAHIPTKASEHTLKCPNPALRYPEKHNLLASSFFTYTESLPKMNPLS